MRIIVWWFYTSSNSYAVTSLDLPALSSSPKMVISISKKINNLLVEMVIDEKTSARGFPS